MSAEELSQLRAELKRELEDVAAAEDAAKRRGAHAQKAQEEADAAAKRKREGTAAARVRVAAARAEAAMLEAEAKAASAAAELKKRSEKMALQRVQDARKSSPPPACACTPHLFVPKRVRHAFFPSLEQNHVAAQASESRHCARHSMQRKSG
jgi:chromosome segregation ATPase